MTLEFSRQIFEKYSKFHENTSRGSRVVPCGRAGGQTDRQDEINSHFPKFCERAKKNWRSNYFIYTTGFIGKLWTGVRIS